MRSSGFKYISVSGIGEGVRTFFSKHLSTAVSNQQGLMKGSEVSTCVLKKPLGQALFRIFTIRA